ncbi:hypothetical protein BG011_009690 [Mortierella polycephala]|uniref:F-box domain-containing protein n=1 Tax=Mortierella polycephala TaxID=41804 RepID=A0A9P6TVI2_9FUNG|nr:hypothetical protein BG011_009690 [Mortierella polycephala]
MATQVRKSRRLIEKAEKAADEAQKLNTVEAPPPPFAPASTRKRSASSALVTKRKKSAPPQVKQKRKAEKDIDTELDSNNKKKKTKTTPKEKAQSADKKQKAVVDEENQDGVNEPKPKRPRQSKKKADDTAPTSTALVVPPVNPSDPCSLFPLEIWHQILSCLPISQVATISMVSKTWLDGCRTLSLWKHICIQNRYGQPKIKYKSYMAMVCARSYFVCEWCFSHTEGKRPKRSSNIPLVIEIKRKPLPPVLLKSFEHAIQASGEESTEAIAQDSTEVATEMSAQESAQEATKASAQDTTKEPSQRPTQKDSKLSQGHSQDQSDDQSDDQQLSTPVPSHLPLPCHRQQQSLDIHVSTQNQDGVLDAQKAATAIALILKSVTDQKAADDSTLQASSSTAISVQDQTQPVVASVPSTAASNTASAHAPKADNPTADSVSPAEAKDNDKGKENDENKEDDDSLVTDRWVVCLECRQRYFKEHPESFHLESVTESHGRKHTPKITKTRAKGSFALTDDDMYTLPYDELENPHYRYAAPMMLFEQEDVQTLALDIHGGWVGIHAAKGSEARRRQLVYQIRSLAVLNRNPEKTGAKRKVVAVVKPERELEKEVLLGNEVPLVREEEEEGEEEEEADVVQ